MKALLRSLARPNVAALLLLAPFILHAGAITMSATYYSIDPRDQDMNRLPYGVLPNEVQNRLGPNGLPMLNMKAYGCTSSCFFNTQIPADLTANGELTWWSPALNAGGEGGISDIIQTGVDTITLPYRNGAFYPPNGTGKNSESGFQAAVFSSILNVPSAESISFNLGADDVAFVYLDGSIVCDLGGVHIMSPGTCTSNTMAAGSHTLTLFYADLHRTEAALTFGVTTSEVTGTAMPEPGTLVLLSTALAGLSVIRLRAGRRNRMLKQAA